MNIGTNVYGLGDRMHRDLSGLMQQVKAIGFTSIEPLIVFSEDVAAFANDPNFPKFLWLDTETPAKIAAINEIGMAVTTCHYNFAPTLDVRAKKDAIIRLAGETSLRSFVISLMLTRAEDCERHAAAFNDVIDELSDAGLTLLYHNHDVEFTLLTVDGRQITALDYFMSLCDPRIKLQVDVGWAVFGGADEVELIRTHCARIGSIHLKDFDRHFKVANREKDIVAVGEGILRLEQIFAEAAKCDLVANGIVFDQDCSRGDIMDDLRTGLENCRKYLA